MFGQSAVTGDCLQGHYCRTSVTIISPVAEYAADWNTGDPADGNSTTNPITGVTNWWEVGVSSVGTSAKYGDVCEKGNICGQAVTQMTACLSGYYCPSPYMNSLDISASSPYECREGFYCKGGAYSMTPGNYIYFSTEGEDPTGDICRKGHYCPKNSAKQSSCPPSTFCPYEMALNYDDPSLPTDCIPCPEGKYCDSSAMYDLSAQDCTEGYYCSGSATTATQNQCTFN